jgi:hypothetical protein
LWREIVDNADFRLEIFNKTRVTGHIFGIMVHAPKANPPRRNTKRIHMPTVIPTLPISLSKTKKRGLYPALGFKDALKKSSI